ncbi:CDP-alcohol phosphatidyltransferase family protein [Elusimicrobiota bacterium]
MSLANKLTILRIIMAPLFLITLIYGFHKISLVFFFASALTDLFDGFVAKKQKQTSNIGAFLDPLADKVLLIPAYISLAFMGLIAPWMCILFFVRDFAVIAGWLLRFAGSRRLATYPRMSGKVAISCQMVFFLIILGCLAYPEMIADLRHIMVYYFGLAVTAATLVSFIDYAATGAKEAFSV